MEYQDQQLSKLLRHDPLANAERMTGKSYKEDEVTLALGFLSHIEHGSRLKRELESRDDTTFSNEVRNYTRIIGEEGFEKWLELPFACKRSYDPSPRNESFQIWFNRRDAILLAFDTYHETSVNSASFMYNWIPNDFENMHQFTSSGSTIQAPDGRWVWYGDHDGREAIRHHLKELRSNGKFVNPWVERPYLKIFDHGFHHSIEDLQWDARLLKINEEESRRLSLLPADVRKAIGL